MNENTWSYDKFARFIDPDDYKYTVIDYESLVNKNVVLDYITKIRETKALPVLYNSLTIDEKRELMDLILNDTELL